jgi:prephenate dehydrogenase
MGGLTDAGDLPFRSAVIVGVGLIGGSLALALRRAWPGLRIGGVDRGDALAAARYLVAFDALGRDAAAMGPADLIVLAAPVQQNIAVLEALGRDLTQPTLVTDVGSTKRAIAVAAAALPAHLSFVGGHPLAGAARGGLELARADLFAGRPWLLTPTASTRSAVDLQRLTRCLEAIDAKPMVVDADEHDRLLAWLSHLPQLAASALMHTVGQAAGPHIDLAGPGLADTTRLASSPASIWQDICLTNADHIRESLDALIASLTTLRDGLTDEGTVGELFASAQEWRARLTTQGPGARDQGPD